MLSRYFFAENTSKQIERTGYFSNLFEHGFSTTRQMQNIYCLEPSVKISFYFGIPQRDIFYHQRYILFKIFKKKKIGKEK